MKAQPADYPQYTPEDDARFVDGGRRCIAWSTTQGRRCIAPCVRGLDVCMMHKRLSKKPKETFSQDNSTMSACEKTEKLHEW